MSTITNVAAVAGDLNRRGVGFAAPIAQAAARHNVDPVLLAAVAAQETGGPGAASGRNIVGDGGHGHGIFQIDDRWHAFAQSAKAMDPASNADYAAGMLHDLLQKYGGDEHRALSAYNAGSPQATGTVTDWGDGKRLGYADSVMRHYAQLSGSAPRSASTETAATASQLTDELLAEAPSAFQSINQLGNFAAGQQQPSSYAPTEAPVVSFLDPGDGEES